MIASRKLDRLTATAEEIKTNGIKTPAKLEFMQCNIRKEDEVSI
jgi:hypothetical protein